jgi:hypothetical protein
MQRAEDARVAEKQGGHVCTESEDARVAEKQGGHLSWIELC